MPAALSGFEFGLGPATERIIIALQFIGDRGVACQRGFIGAQAVRQINGKSQNRLQPVKDGKAGCKTTIGKAENIAT